MTDTTEYLQVWLDRHRAEQSTLREARSFLDGVPAEPWMAESACSRAAHADAWFPTHGGSDPETDLALKVCRELCPVQATCLTYALERPHLDGIWGGTTATARMRIRAKASTPKGTPA